MDSAQWVGKELKFYRPFHISLCVPVPGWWPWGPVWPSEPTSQDDARTTETHATEAGNGRSTLYGTLKVGVSSCIILINSLAPGRSECDSKNVIFNLVLLIGIFRSSHDNALRRMPQDLTDDKSTLVQVMAWCRQATSHYLSQCWLSSLSSYGVARPQ